MTHRPRKTDEEVLAEMASQLPRKLLRILKHGKKVLDKNTGEVVTVDPTAADLNVMRALIKDRGGAADTPETNPIATRVAALRASGALRLAGGELQPVDLENDDRATA